MTKDHSEKKIADGIRIRTIRAVASQKNGSAVPNEAANVFAVPSAGQEIEEPAIRTYVQTPIETDPNAPDAISGGVRSLDSILAEPASETPAAGGFGSWFSFPRKKNVGQISIEDDHTFSERIAVRNRLSSGQYAFRGVLAGVVLIAAAGIGCSTVLSRATVRVKPKIEAATIQDVSVVFDASVSQPISGQKIIPAERLHFMQTSVQEVPAGGTKYTETRSRGTVKISNGYSTASQRLVGQTRFMAPSGALFRLANSVVIPGAVAEKGTLSPRSVDVELMADAPGEEYNLSGPVSLKIPGFQGTPKYRGFAVTAQNGFSGGARGMKKIASDADMQNAQQQATKKAYDEMKEQMRQKTPPGLRLVDGLQEIRIAKIETADSGQERDKLAVRATAEGDALVFHEDDVAALLKSALLPQDNSKTFVEGSMNLEYIVRTLNFERERADVVLQGSVKIRQPLAQQQRDDLSRVLAGKKEGSLREFFNSRSDVVLSSVSIFPPWKSALPSNAGHILIEDDE